MGDDAKVLGVGLDEAVKFFAFERGFGSEHANGVCLGEVGGGFDAGFHADEGDEVLGAEGFDRNDGGGVTGDDDGFGSLLKKEVGEGEDAFANLRVGFVSVWAPFVVSDV